MQDVLDEINHFLNCETPDEWIAAALSNQDILLIDHANCEKKAASTAISLLSKHVSKEDLLKKMSQLAREELLHFEQVINLMRKRDIEYRYISPARYAAALRQPVRAGTEGELTDILIIGAIIEARSCERFAKLAPFLDDELAKFYRSLLRSEGRHYQDYLSLASTYTDEDITPRIKVFTDLEAELIQAPDKEFRFHSGIPA